MCVTPTAAACHCLRRLPPQGPALKLVVRRAALLEDANVALQGAGADIRRPLHVSFVSEHGHLEAGIDQVLTDP